MTAVAAPMFCIVGEGGPDERALADKAAAACAPVLGFAPQVEAAVLDSPQAPVLAPSDGEDAPALPEVFERAGEGPLFMVPALLEFSLQQRQVFAERVAQARKGGQLAFYDAPDPCHPLVLHALVEGAARALGEGRLNPAETGLLVVASGHGDATDRARAYQCMRLIWEQLGCAQGEVAFLRHEKTPVPEQLLHCAARRGMWIVVPLFLWPGEHEAYLRVLLEDFARRHAAARAWRLCPPVGGHANVAAWIQQRLVGLWREYSRRQEARQPSARRGAAPRGRIHGPGRALPLDQLADGVPAAYRYGPGLIAEVGSAAELKALLAAGGLPSPGPYLVKVTWHGYAPGTYTDPTALDALLTALPGKAVLLEGHSVGRNRGGAEWDWEKDSRRHRVWIREQEAEYLRRTGLAEVIQRHGAEYLNVTEAYWDGRCACRDWIEKLLAARGVRLRHPELAGFVPAALMEWVGAPFLSFARFKGPTRLGVSNCFGLLPAPLRTAWHGPNVTYFAEVCCDVARMYGALFQPYGMVEGLNVAVRWQRDGLYRSRWGNYRLIQQPGLVTFSRGLAAADGLASRLQGQDVQRSAFFDVVDDQLGLAPEVCCEPICETLTRRFA